MNLNREQFLTAVERGQALLKELKQDYSELELKPVFSRFGPRSGQCELTTDLRKIVVEFPDMLAGEIIHHERTQRSQNVDATSSSRSRDAENIFSRKKAQNSQKGENLRLRELLKAIKRVENDGEKGAVSNLWKEAAAVEKALLDPDLELYCGDVLILSCGLRFQPLEERCRNFPLFGKLSNAGVIKV
jgi:hypothetical protein